MAFLVAFEVSIGKAVSGNNEGKGTILVSQTSGCSLPHAPGEQMILERQSLARD